MVHQPLQCVVRAQPNTLGAVVVCVRLLHQGSPGAQAAVCKVLEATPEQEATCMCLLSLDQALQQLPAFAYIWHQSFSEC